MMVRKLIFLFNFGLSKAAVYAVPLLIAAVAPASVYGAIEFGWAFALLAAAIVVGAPLGGINQRFLVHNDGAVLDELAVVVAAGALVALLLWGVGAALDLRLEWQVAFASLGVAVLHNVASTLFRMRGDRNLTAWFDGTATITAGLIIALLWLVSSQMNVARLGQAYALAAAGIAASGVLGFALIHKPNLRARMARSWSIGLPMLAGGILAMWLGVGGRMIIGFLKPDLVATYSVMFRVAGLALGIHQLAVTAMFARIYGARTREADRLLLPFLAGVAALTALIAIVAPLMVHMAGFESLAGGGEEQFRLALPIVALQVYFWIAFAMLQMRVNRAGLAGRAFWPTFFVTVAGTALILGAAKLFDLGLVGLCWGIALHSVAYYAVEWGVLTRAGLPHVKVGWCSLVAGALLVVIAIINQLAQASS